MTDFSRSLFQISLAAVVGTVCLFGSDRLSLRDPGSLVTRANAVIGRPMTPMSYAGVARRTTRRAVVGTAAVGAVAVGAARCAQVVNVYGQIVTQCY